MKTIQVNLYSFDELDEKAKEKVLSDLYDINVDYEWWDFTYEDAANIGLKLTGFDIGRGNYCNGNLTMSIFDSIKKVLSEHGETCETYRTALDYQEELNNLDETDENYEDELERIEEAYLKDMLENYRIILSDEYDHLTSKEAIIETIDANSYTFEANGKMRNF